MHYQGKKPCHQKSRGSSLLFAAERKLRFSNCRSCRSRTSSLKAHQHWWCSQLYCSLLQVHSGGKGVGENNRNSVMNDLEDWSFTWMADLKGFCLDGSTRVHNTQLKMVFGCHHHHDWKAKEIMQILRHKHKSPVSQWQFYFFLCSLSRQ